MTLQELTQAVWQEKLSRYPYSAARSEAFLPLPFTARDANSLTRSIEAFIRITGHYCDRINNVGIYDKRTGKYRSGGTRKGIADIMATKKVEYDDRIYGIAVAIEVKWGKDRMSPDQLKIKAEIERTGGVYIIARTWEQFIQEWNQIK
jgi:hypothetical protein